MTGIPTGPLDEYYWEGQKAAEPEVIMVPRDNTVAQLVKDYADGNLSYSELSKEFAARGWSTVSLYENVRHLRK